MQPIASIASRPTLIMSQPSASAFSAASGNPSRPAPMNTTSSARPARAKSGYTRDIASLNGSATWSLNVIGAAPVPPSPPSMVTKSGPPPVAAMRDASVSQKPRSPTADLTPTGSPVASATRSTNAISPSTSENAEWAAGLAQSRPIGTPRMRAMCSVTFAAGSSPPSPGLAPWDSLISIARTGASATRS
jgi:hypothetical protein